MKNSVSDTELQVVGIVQAIVKKEGQSLFTP
jgi:hypothetical protein